MANEPTAAEQLDELILVCVPSFSQRVVIRKRIAALTDEVDRLRKAERLIVSILKATESNPCLRDDLWDDCKEIYSYEAKEGQPDA